MRGNKPSFKLEDLNTFQALSYGDIFLKKLIKVKQRIEFKKDILKFLRANLKEKSFDPTQDFDRYFHLVFSSR